MNKSEFCSTYNMLKPEVWVFHRKSDEFLDGNYKWTSATFSGRYTHDLDGNIIACEVKMNIPQEKEEHTTTRWLGMSFDVVTNIYVPTDVERWVESDDIRFSAECGCNVPG